jgi:hypothetical protein
MGKLFRNCAAVTAENLRYSRRTRGRSGTILLATRRLDYKHSRKQQRQEEKLLAIISDEPLALDWLSSDPETSPRILSGEDI